MLITPEIKERVAKIAEKYGLDLVVLFGSQATGKVHKESDIDLAVLSRHSFNEYQMSAELENVFHRSDIEMVDLSSASPTLMYCVVSDGVLLYEKEAEAFFIWKMYALQVWRDTEWLRNLRDKKLIEWAHSV